MVGFYAGKGKSDPYAIITVGAQQWKTKHIDNEVNPRWNFWCEVSYRINTSWTVTLLIPFALVKVNAPFLL